MIRVSEQEKGLKNYRFIDLFAGIGGFHYALKSFDAECVFSSEINKNASNVYYKNHGIKPFGDITQIDEKHIPQHEILCAGFPCQAFSISGKQKGFDDTRGTLFFDIARIVRYHQPKILLLENVKNLFNHDKGNTFKKIKNTLESLNYTVFHQVMNTSAFGLPQNRERIYIVCFHKNFIKHPKFVFPKIDIASKLSDILEEHPQDTRAIERDDIEFYKTHTPDFDIFNNEILLNKPIQIGKVSKGRQGERIYDINGHSITLSAHGGGVGAKTGLYKVDNIVRKLSPRECARLQGFPESFIFDTSITQAHQQFGNSISIDVLQYVLKKIVQII